MQHTTELWNSLLLSLKQMAYFSFLKGVNHFYEHGEPCDYIILRNFKKVQSITLTVRSIAWSGKNISIFHSYSMLVVGIAHLRALLVAQW